ncbi:hypothetical protein FRC12_018084 [Ceratobasidium sp. 428]|nr:hypothetical protein FRC12_018084 [Ceratobasidium sp. 428]
MTNNVEPKPQAEMTTTPKEGTEPDNESQKKKKEEEQKKSTEQRNAQLENGVNACATRSSVFWLAYSSLVFAVATSRDISLPV